LGQLEKPGRGLPGLIRDLFRPLQPSVPWLAAATALVAVVFLTYHLLSSDSGAASGRNTSKPLDSAENRPAGEGVASVGEPARANLARDGRVDILDALILAERLQSGPVRDLGWDANGDGVVDERDVRAIAVQAVRLDKGGRS
jgi:hypothetical protein